MTSKIQNQEWWSLHCFLGSGIQRGIKSWYCFLGSSGIFNSLLQMKRIYSVVSSLLYANFTQYLYMQSILRGAVNLSQNYGRRHLYLSKALRQIIRKNVCLTWCECNVAFTVVSQFKKKNANIIGIYGQSLRSGSLSRKWSFSNGAKQLQLVFEFISYPHNLTACKLRFNTVDSYHWKMTEVKTLLSTDPLASKQPTVINDNGDCVSGELFLLSSSHTSVGIFYPTKLIFFRRRLWMVISPLVKLDKR